MQSVFIPKTLDETRCIITNHDSYLHLYDFSYKNNSYKSGVSSNNGDVLKSFTKELYTNFIKETNNNNNNNNQ